MKVAVLLCCCFALGSCRNMIIGSHDEPTDFVDMVKSYGYPVESYDVQTEDGYILTMFRIPGGRQENRKKHSEHETRYTSPSPTSTRGAVFLMHGMMTNCESFIYGGPSESMALYLADEGYDVFLGNARGTIYGQKHTTLDPKKDSAFWRFSWDQIGTKDLPAMINKALSVSGKDQLSYIGHNEGTTSFYVLASEMPEMSSKIERHISLGPLVFLRNSTNEILLSIETHVKQRSWLIKNLGVNTFSPTDVLTHDAKINCMEKLNEETMCKNVYLLLNGYNSKHLNQTTIKWMLTRVPSMASVREILHLVQLKTTGRFEMYSEELNGKQYDLSKVTIPVALFYTPRDSLSRISDVDMLSQMLPNVYWRSVMQNLDNNLDLLYSENMNQVTEKVVEALQRDLDVKKSLE